MRSFLFSIDSLYEVVCSDRNITEDFDRLETIVLLYVAGGSTCRAVSFSLVNRGWHGVVYGKQKFG